VIQLKIKANDYRPNEIIKIVREWTGLTQEQFGKAIHRSKHTVQSMELGRNNIYLHTLLELADQYGLTVTIEKR
jgi:DNA-binding XRE family transcriptional regulator